MDLQIAKYDGVDVVNSRDVAEMLGKQHKHLIRDINGYAAIIQQSTETNFGLSDFFIKSSYKDSTGRTLPCYLLTKKGCDMVANKMTGEKGVLFTAAYVTAFEKMRETLATPKFALPQDYPSALRALADAEEQRLALAAKVEADAPKVETYERLAARDGLTNIRDTAKLLGIPQKAA